MYFDNGHMDGAWGWVMGLGMIGLWILVAAGIIWFVRSNRAVGYSAPAAGANPTESAERILAERLARGEIDQTEYESRRTTLTG